MVSGVNDVRSDGVCREEVIRMKGDGDGWFGEKNVLCQATP